MKKINQLYAGILMLALVTLLFSGCKKNEQGEDSRIPEGLKNVSVENIPGGAIISYDAPTDGSAVLITAMYPTEDGGKATLRFDLTKYASEFTLKGLTMGDRTVELYTVSASGNKSASVEVEIEPLLSLSLAYLNTVLESIVFEPIPSGVSFSFQNIEEKLLSFILFVKDENNEWKEYKNFQSESLSEVFRMDDFLSSEVRLQIEDADSEERTSRQDYAVEYLEEILLDKNWKNAALPGDNWEGIYLGRNYWMENLWDGDYNPATTPRFGNKPAEFPHKFTIDLGVEQNLKLSKLRVYHWARGQVADSFGNLNPKTFEVWGSNEPHPSGNWEGWVKLMECESIKPSGLPIGQVQQQDFDHLRAGEDYQFPLNTPAYRYLRFKVLNTWGINPIQEILLKEITLWGVE